MTRAAIAATPLLWLAISLAIGCEQQVASLPGSPKIAPQGESGRVNPPNLVDQAGGCPPTDEFITELPCENGATCEYGTSPDLRCNALYRCTNLNTRAWSGWLDRPARACGDCPAPTAIDEMNGAPCAAVLTSTEDEQICNMRDGVCACTSSSDEAGSRTWRCVRPEPTCPFQRPRVGSSCPFVLSCDYGSCAFKNGVRMTCIDSTWQVATSVCD